jgi:biotin transporter BioY
MKHYKLAISAHYGVLTWLFYVIIGFVLSPLSSSMGGLYLVAGPIVGLLTGWIKYRSMRSSSDVL